MQDLSAFNWVDRINRHDFTEHDSQIEKHAVDGLPAISDMPIIHRPSIKRKWYLARNEIYKEGSLCFLKCFLNCYLFE